MTQKINDFKNSRLSIAPMMAWTDRHCRFFHRLISPHSLLYTEMVTTGALTYGDQDKHLSYNTQEHPIALQLGGNSPKDLAFSAKLGEDYGYDEINLNCGCPSDRVQSGAFGASLMNVPDLVAECVDSMQHAVKIPITIKCRIGIDESDDYNFLEQFVSTIVQTGASHFIIHARKAWLKGLSPKENREIPPLRYDIVQRLKKEHPHLTLILNGGIQTIEDIKQHLTLFDGVMLGREAYKNPWILSAIEKEIFNAPSPSREEIVHSMQDYINTSYAPSQSIVRHMMGLFKGEIGGKIWRQTLSDHGNSKNILLTALEKVKKT